MKKEIWDLFKITGDIKYYMMYKEVERQEALDVAEENKRNRSNRH